jgi:LysM repeat protein/plastocyanin
MKHVKFRTFALVTIFSIALAFLAMAAPQATDAAARDNPAPQAATVNSGYCTTVVQRGDALYKIAWRYGTTTAYLASLNNLYNPNYIYAGMVLKVPCSPSPQPHPQPYPQPKPQPKPQPHPGPGPVCTYYKVLRGDWLKTIAVRFGISWQLLAQVNGLYNANYIYAGQQLAIPCPQPFPPKPYPPQPYPPQPYPPQPYPPVPPPYPTQVPPLLNIVQAKDDFYTPAVITVRIGSFVQWINGGKEPHTVTQGLCPGGVCTPTPGGFNSGVLAPGQTYGFQFNQLGTFAYFCQIHGAAMTGSVAVVP